MKKTTLLSIALLVCPAVILPMDSNFPKLNSPKKINRNKKKPSSNIEKSDNIIEKSDNINNSDQESIIIDTTNNIVPNDTNVENNDQSIINFLTESSPPVEQEKRGLLGKIWSMGKSCRDLSVYWLSQKQIPEKNREQAQNDIKWGITEENKGIKANRNNNENFVNILKNCEKNSSSRHEIILKMAAYLKKNEDHTQHLDKFVHGR